jgi:hypothetical protein
MEAVMTQLNPLKFGAVLSLTVVINYALCTVLFVAFPGPSLDFVNGLFHGMDFGKIYGTKMFSAGVFGYVLVILAVWSYVLGAVYALVRNWLRPESRQS